MQPPQLADSIAPISQEEDDDSTYRDNLTAEAMKKYEAVYKLTLPHDNAFIIRLDGHRFSKFTKGFIRPFDQRIATAMARTTADLLVYFSCRLGYTQSDEITLVFTPAEPTQDGTDPHHPYNGVVLKIATLAAGYCTARFVHHMSSQVFGPTENELKEKIAHVHFDARAFSIPSASEALRNVWWRQNDCKCNSKLNLGTSNLKQKEVEGLSPAQIVKKLRAEKNIEWRDMPGAYKWGVFLKKGKVSKEGFNPKTGEHIPAVERGVMMIATFSISFYAFLVALSVCDSDGVTTRNELLMTSKYSNDVPHLSGEFKTFDH